MLTAAVFRGTWTKAASPVNSTANFLRCFPGAAAWRGAGLALVILAGGRAEEPSGEPVRAVTGGAVRGHFLPDGGAVFRGIPFAAPPVGPRRWREPQPVLPWSGVRAADQPGPPPIQERFAWNVRLAEKASEDCLFLDVWTPSPNGQSRLPVMVWIHGGANTALAGGCEPVYEGHHLIRQGVVLVVIEYRLGILGFFAHPELSRESPHGVSGNYALLDQIAALQWVRENITRFGGDPEKVTVFGQSAGAWDIVALMASPLASGLFQRAIAESGVPPSSLSVPRAELERRGSQIADKLRAPAEGALAFLRQCSPAELLQAAPGMNNFCIDDWLLPASPSDAWKDRHERAVPLIIGGNAIEFPATGSWAEIRSAIAGTFGDLEPKAVSLYGLDRDGPGMVDPVYGDLRDQWGSDLYFRLPGVVHGEWHHDAGNPVWQYEFDRALPPQPRVQHSTELAYVFGNFREKDGMVTGRPSGVDRELSDKMLRYWTNFAKTGNPNGPGLPEWPEYAPPDRSYLVFTTSGQVRAARNQRGALADLFRELLNRPAPSRGGPGDRRP